MDFLQAFILSIVEGITEFLPISSTGHLILTSQLLGIPETDFVKTFEIFIQSGAILSVLVLYARELLTRRTLWKPVLLAFIPTAVIGLALYKVIKSLLIGNIMITLWALLLGGVAIILVEKYFKVAKSKGHKVEDLTPRQAITIGLIQAISVIPGVSRSAATILGGMGVGLSREAAVEMSFLLAIPTLFAATGLDLLKSFKTLHSDQFGMLGFGFVVTFIVALVVIKWFLSYVRRQTLIPFGVYRIFVGGIFLVLIYLH